MNKHGNRVLLGIIVGVAVAVATLTTAMMGQPADITSDTGYPAGSTVESSATGQAPTNSVDDDRNASDGIACFTPTDEGSPENLAGCNFDPHKRYSYVGSGFGKGAWVAVPDGFTYANGNRPPTGAELNAVRDGTYDREVNAGS